MYFLIGSNTFRKGVQKCKLRFIFLSHACGETMHIILVIYFSD